MSNVVGNKMSDCTPLDPSEKEYFFGEGEGAVVTVGEVTASSGKVNRLVQLTDIAGDALPTIKTGDAGKVLTVNTNEDGVQWSEGSISYDSAYPIAITSYFGGDQKIELQYNNNDFTVDEGGVLELVTPMPEIGDTENRGKFLKVADDSDELVFDNLPSELPEIGTSQHRGEYLKVDDNSDNLVWDTIPTAPTYTAGTGIDITSNAISVTRPVPDPGNNQHRGHVLTVNNSDDNIEWAVSNGVPSISSLDSTKTYKLQCDKGVLKWVEDKSGS